MKPVIKTEICRHSNQSSENFSPLSIQQFEFLEEYLPGLNWEQSKTKIIELMSLKEQQNAKEVKDSTKNEF
jgi:hypothetical protein